MELGNADVAEMEPKAVEGLTLQRKIPQARRNQPRTGRKAKTGCIKAKVSQRAEECDSRQNYFALKVGIMKSHRLRPIWNRANRGFP